MIVKLHSCGVNYQNDYIRDCLEKNYELTNEFDEADTIVMLGGCCCSDENIYATLMQINYILSKKRENAITYLTGCITRGFKNVEEYKELEKNIKNNIDFVIEHYNPNELLKLINSQSQKSENFDNFDFNKYSDVSNPVEYNSQISPRDNIKKICEIAKLRCGKDKNLPRSVTSPLLAGICIPR